MKWPKRLSLLPENPRPDISALPLGQREIDLGGTTITEGRVAARQFYVLLAPAEATPIEFEIVVPCRIMAAAERPIRLRLRRTLPT